MDYVYGVLSRHSRDEAELVVLPEDRAEELAEIRDLLCSRTWGELRRKASPSRYRELLGKLGYGEFAELAAELNIGAGVRGALEMALADFDPHAVPPGDGEPFDADEVAGDSEGEYPPDPRYLQNLLVAPEVVDRWGKRYQGSHELSCVMLRADDLRDIITSLEADGHTCREDAELIQAGFGEEASSAAAGD